MKKSAVILTFFLAAIVFTSCTFNLFKPVDEDEQIKKVLSCIEDVGVVY
ncbi:MAG: hypothetical protein K6A43_04140 [Treponema sp.]|nr:hypothetical protein [Treponema sp.]